MMPVQRASLARNSVTVDFNQNFAESNVVKGIYKDNNTLFASAMHQIGGLQTESFNLCRLFFS